MGEREKKRIPNSSLSCIVTLLRRLTNLDGCTVKLTRHGNSGLSFDLMTAVYTVSRNRTCNRGITIK